MVTLKSKLKSESDINNAGRVKIQKFAKNYYNWLPHRLKKHKSTY